MMIVSILYNTSNASTSFTTTTPSGPKSTEHIHGHTVHLNAEFFAQEIFLGLISILGIFGNGLVCYTVVKRTQTKNSTWYYLSCLSVSDLFVCAVNIPILMFTTYDETYIESDSVLCQFNGFSLVCFFLTSMLTLSTISIDKYLHIKRPLHSRASNNSIKVIALIWIVSISLALGPLIGWSEYSHVHGHKQCIPASQKPVQNIDYSYLITLMVIGFFLPLISMIYCYTTILIETLSHHKRLKTNSIRGESSQMGRSEGGRKSVRYDWGILKTVFVVVTTFIVCWTPFIVYLCYNFTQHTEPSSTLAQLAFMLGYTQSIANPVIYALRHDYFRGQFKSLVCCSIYGTAEIAQSNSYVRSGSSMHENTKTSGLPVHQLSRGDGSSGSDTKLVFYKRRGSNISQRSIGLQEPKLERITETIPSVAPYENKGFETTEK